MHRTRLYLAAIGVAVGLAAVWGAAPTQAAEPPAVRLAPSLQAPADGLLQPEQARETLSLFVRLQGPSVSQQFSADKAAAALTHRAPMDGTQLTTLRSALAARQLPARRAIAATGASVVDDFQTVANGFLVHAKRAQIPALLKVPGVVAIERMPLAKLNLTNAVPWIKADKVWQDLGFDGAGTVVAVIDTGTDYTHADFGGSGNPEDFQANDPTVVEPGSFPTAKVIGGYDLAGETYAPGCQPGTGCTPNPEPDDDPLDQGGHGTHTSGIVAGQGVTATSLGKGVAPGAKLVALKVFGSGSTDLATSAIEWVTEHNLGMAVDGTAPKDKIDVINMSLGSSFGPETTVDDEAVDAAVAAGVTVVASAGNAGDVPFIVGSPSTSHSALSVASSMDQGDWQGWVTAEWTTTSPQKMEPLYSESGSWTVSVEQAGKITAPLAWYGLACSDTEGNPPPPAQDVREKIALVQRGTCPFYDKVKNAQAFGAVAVIVYSDGRPRGAMGCGAPSPCETTLQIPAVLIDTEPGDQLKTLVTGGTAVTATIDPASRYSLADVVSDFSSRGPGRYSFGIKPQITAPGQTIVSAAMGTGTGGVDFGGTSMSGPMVAGVTALLAQRNKVQKLGLGALDLAALAMNYGRQSIELTRTREQPKGPAVGVARQGAGQVDALRAAKGNTVVRTPDGIAELSFGLDSATKDQVKVAKTITVRNLGSAAKRYKLGSKFLFADDQNQGVGFQIDPAELTVEPGKTADATVTAVISPARLREWDLRSFEFLMNPGKMERLEIDGTVSVTEVGADGQPVAGGDTPTVPFYILPRRQSCLVPTDLKPFSLMAENDTFDQSWTNACPQVAPMQPVAWIGSDPAESAKDSAWPGKLDVKDVGSLHFPQDEAAPDGNQVLVMAIGLNGASRLPIDSEMRVYFDYDKDGKYDEVIFNVYAPYLTNQPQFALKFMVVHTTLLADGITPDISNINGTVFFQTYDVNDQVAFLPVLANELNGGKLDLTSGTVSFNTAVSVGDAAGDYPATDTFPGFDLAPDGAFDKTHKVYSYDQQWLDCLHVLDSSGVDTGPIGTGAFTVPANTTNLKPLQFLAACQPPADGVDIGAMYVNLSNTQDGTAGYDVRMGRLGKAAAPPAIYLPYLALSHAFWPTGSLTLNAVGDGGTAGTAKLTQKGGSLSVEIDLPQAATDAPHPAHIHMGTCANPGEVYKPLTAVENGRSVTLLDGVKLADVADGLHYINVHKSAEDMATNLSCGDIPKAP
jgi:subtilisin family serine protease